MRVDSGGYTDDLDKTILPGITRGKYPYTKGVRYLMDFKFDGIRDVDVNVGKLFSTNSSIATSIVLFSNETSPNYTMTFDSPLSTLLLKMNVSDLHFFWEFRDLIVSNFILKSATIKPSFDINGTQMASSFNADYKSQVLSSFNYQGQYEGYLLID